MKKTIRRIKKCSACGKSHSNIKADKLKNQEAFRDIKASHSYFCKFAKRLVYIQLNY